MDNRKKYITAVIAEAVLIVLFGLYMFFARKYDNFMRLACDATFSAATVFLAIGAIAYVARSGGFNGMRYLSYKARAKMPKAEKEKTGDLPDDKQNEMPKSYNEFIKDSAPKAPSCYAMLKVGGVVLVISIILTIVYMYV